MFNMLHEKIRKVKNINLFRLLKNKDKNFLEEARLYYVIEDIKKAGLKGEIFSVNYSYQQGAPYAELRIMVY